VRAVLCFRMYIDFTYYYFFPNATFVRLCCQQYLLISQGLLNNGDTDVGSKRQMTKLRRHSFKGMPAKCSPIVNLWCIICVTICVNLFYPCFLVEPICYTKMLSVFSM
jgi:hypothetical protein